MTQRLLLISPVRNEEVHIELIAEAVARQTRPPDLWLIVDDGSTDRTPEILASLMERIEFLQVLNTADLPPVGPVNDRLATAAEARAFNLGLNSVAWESFTHIAKLDGDTELPPNYFERVLNEFERDPELGLAGGLYADPDPRGDGWEVVSIPSDYHVPGTLKCYSLACFQAVGGVQERLGWDTIDETYARLHGYRTRAFVDLVALHHRPRASADGTLRGRARHGECAYIAHFTLLWVTLRTFKMALAPPRGLSGVAFLYGYLRSAVRRTPRVDDPAFRRFVRHELRGRMLVGLGLAKLQAVPRAESN
ncbi:MAG TPA: glycosyltransferase [Solirubrobacteraceae bacterium]|jgi:biofilm PGA synthesis N-glycosyltransferase PgaC|nr:glycosyltransferase [Solirubrobacteraceae bacterium]